MIALMIVSFLALSVSYRTTHNALRTNRVPRLFSTKKPEPPVLLPDPMNNAIGNFFEKRDDDSMSFIQCYMLALGYVRKTINGLLKF